MPHKDWSHDTRDRDGELKKVIKNKLNSIASKEGKDALNSLVRELEENVTRYREIKDLALNKREKSVNIATLDSGLKDRLDTTADIVYLSRDTVIEHLDKDAKRGINIFDYSLMHYGINNIYKIEPSGKDSHIVCFSKLNYYYRAILKTTQNKKEVFLLSLIKSTKKL